MTTPLAYYNEFDPDAAEWLKRLILAGAIAPGVVDTRSIEDVRPNDLKGFTQCHFFAGIGVWSHALRTAGWEDSRPVWTASCPCQPFSAAGKGDGFTDERHLWPHLFHLIEQCGPKFVFGEQVASRNADVWFDLVQSDLERVGYAFGLVPFTSASVGAPHIRERAYWVADATGEQYHQRNLCSDERRWATHPQQNRMGGGINGLGNSNVARLEGLSGNDCPAGGEGSAGPVAASSVYDGMADPQSEGLPYRRAGETQPIVTETNRESLSARSMEANSFWGNADWLLCRDGKWRSVEPGTFPLVNGFTKNMGRDQPQLSGMVRSAGRNRKIRLKGYGNALNAVAATTFIKTFMGLCND